MQISGSYKLTGDVYEGFYSCGLSMLKNGTMGKTVIKQKDDNQTIYENENGIILTVNHTKNEKTGATEVVTSIMNKGDRPQTLELLTSFVLENVAADKIYRIESFWSAEGRVKTDDVEELNLERSWNKMAIRVEKFGNLGSMPVRRYFPFVVLEDSKTGKFTAIQLYSPSSWQLEIFCQREEALTVSGGIADRDFGGWTKTLQPGEVLVAPKAVIAEGTDLDDVCNILVKTQSPNVSPVDNKMGITFNEYCTTWGNPTIENLKRLADKLYEEAPGQIQYLVMDSGWYLADGEYWWERAGDWNVDKGRFPNGLKELTDYIRSKGMIPGIWFEFEVACDKTELYHQTEHLLKKDGVPLTIANRRFVDMEDPWIQNYLKEKMIGLLKDNGFGYVKIDYNDTIGIGVDGRECLAENLRRNVLATQEFFKTLRKEIPELVIENCSSGGHRLEPSFMQLASMASFSDAHEIPSLPIIAANVQRVIRAEQNQVWAVMRKGDSPARIFYSLCSTFMGRMGLSGDIYDLSDEQWKLLKDGMDFYIKASEIIKNGKTLVNKCSTKSYNYPKGEQLVVRQFENKYLVVFHRFENSKNAEDTMKNWFGDFADLKILHTYGNADEDFSAQAWILKNF